MSFLRDSIVTCPILRLLRERLVVGGAEAVHGLHLDVLRHNIGFFTDGTWRTGGIFRFLRLLVDGLVLVWSLLNAHSVVTQLRSDAHTGVWLLDLMVV